MGAILRRTEIYPVEAEGLHEVGQLFRVEGGFDSQGCLFFMKQQGLRLALPHLDHSQAIGHTWQCLHKFTPSLKRKCTSHIYLIVRQKHVFLSRSPI